jgi:hypothetical protein
MRHMPWHNRGESGQPRPGQVLIARSGTPIAPIVGNGGSSADAVGTRKVLQVAAAVAAAGLYRGVYVAKHVPPVLAHSSQKAAALPDQPAKAYEQPAPAER